VAATAGTTRKHGWLSQDAELSDYAREKALRPTDKELDAERIEIECVEPPSGAGEGYIVNVWPKGKGKPVKRLFHSEEETLAFVKKVL